MTDAPKPQDGSAPSRDPEDVALKKLLLFQFVVLSGLFALGVPGLAVMTDTPVSPVYIPALLIHAFFLWRLWRFDPSLLPWVEGFALVVVVLPWTAWALRKWLGIEPLITGPILFVTFVFITLTRANRRGD